MYQPVGTLNCLCVRTFAHIFQSCCSLRNLILLRAINYQRPKFPCNLNLEFPCICEVRFIPFIPHTRLKRTSCVFGDPRTSQLCLSLPFASDQYQYLGNCPPTPPLTQQRSIDNKLRLMLGRGGEGRGGEGRGGEG